MSPRCLESLEVLFLVVIFLLVLKGKHGIYR